MGSKNFWVIGGEFRSTDFDELMDGTAQLLGPFGSRSEAEEVWRDTSEQHRSQCTVRYTIVQEPVRAG